MVPIPYGKSYLATVTGSAPKFVVCEQCGVEYVYILNAVGTGESTSLLFLDNEGAKTRSNARAEAEMRANLDEGSCVVPCPKCFRIQQHMITAARSEKYTWLKWCTWWGLVLAPVFCYLGYSSPEEGTRDKGARRRAFLYGSAALAGVLGVGSWPLRSILLRRYDPNAEPLEARQAEATRSAWTKEDFLRLLAANSPTTQTGETGSAN